MILRMGESYADTLIRMYEDAQAAAAAAAVKPGVSSFGRTPIYGVVSSGVTAAGRASQQASVNPPKPIAIVAAAPVPIVQAQNPDEGASFFDKIPRPVLIGGGVAVVLGLGLVAFKLSR